MKKYNLSTIMKRAWEMVKEFGMNISEGLKKAWSEAKAACEKIAFTGIAKVEKIENGEVNNYGEDCCYLTFKLWVGNNGKKRIYVNDYKRRTLAYIDCDNNNRIVTDYSSKSAAVETANYFLAHYAF